MKDTISKLQKLISPIAVIASVGAMTASLISLKKLPEFSLSILGSVLAMLLGYFIGKYAPQKRIKVFVSHSLGDSDRANELAVILRQSGFRVLLPAEELQAGDSLINVIKRSIESADAFVIIISEKAVKSKWIDKEIEIAQKAGRKIFPVVIGSPELPTDLRDIVYTSLKEPIGESVRRLEKAIKNSQLN